MTAPFRGLRAHRAARAETQLGGVHAFVEANRTELLRVMRIAAGEAGTADAETLFGLLGRPRPEIEKVSALLGRMRDDLADAEAGVGSEDHDARSDFDAAMRWHGARLEEIISSIGR